MPTLVPVDNDPFAASSASAAPTLVPVDHDPFAADAGGGGAGEPDKTQFPYDEPGATYGSVVPIEKNRTRRLAFSVAGTDPFSRAWGWSRAARA